MENSGKKQMRVSDHILSYISSLENDWELPAGIDLLYPFGDSDVMDSVRAFYTKFYNDQKPRYFLWGINPGRRGAGVTGIPFTDPIFLEKACGIPNSFDKKHELSSQFIYEMIDNLGGAEHFYGNYYISAVCPLGFVKQNKNYNYYDDNGLYEAVRPLIIKSIEQQVQRFCIHERAYSIGQGKNYKVLKALNDVYGWFNEVIPLPHPRWVMQYRRKSKLQYIDEYAEKLNII